jgi:hypothetical protein
MKKLGYILISVFLLGCNSENAGDCLQTSGNIISQEITTPLFTKILVNEGIELIIKDDTSQRVTVKTGANLMNDIIAEVIENELVLTNANSCNFFRDYGVTKIYVSAPNITDIRSSTQFDISSDGVLSYPSLRLIAEDYNFSEAITVGDFRLQVNNESVYMVFNNLSNCYISGATENLNINFVSGNSRFEGRDLLADNVRVNHRGSNDMIIHPLLSLKGTLNGTGDVISYSRPAIIEVEELYQGKLIFKE